MNYYPRFPGDYMRKTMHLSMLEDGAYTRLLDWYYANDRAIPHDRRYAVARATTVGERSAVDSVLSEFFSLAEGQHHNERADTEIEAARKRIDAAKENGKKGGRKPNKQPNENPLGSDPLNPNHNPDESSLSPNTDSLPKGSSSAASKPRSTKKCPESFEVTPELLRWLMEKAPGVDWISETEKFRDYTFKNAITDWPGTWRNWMRKASEAAATPATPASFRERDAEAAKAAGRRWMGSCAPGAPDSNVIDMEEINARISMG